MAAGDREQLLETVEELLAAGHETRAFETKSSGSLGDKAYVAKVAATMAMGDLKTAAWWCCGIDDQDAADMTPGPAA